MTHHVPPPSSAQIEAARQVVADHLMPTPTISTTIRGRHVFAKMDSLQPVGSFKIRGALAAIADDILKEGIDFRLGIACDNHLLHGHHDIIAGVLHLAIAQDRARLRILGIPSIKHHVAHLRVIVDHPRGNGT